jgi:hypothetical protein
VANTYRYRWGETNPVAVPLEAGVAVELGSLCFIPAAAGDVDGSAGVAGKLYPANKKIWNTDLATTRAAFVAQFAGVAAQAYAGENPITGYGIKDGNLRVDTDGVFEFDTASASYKVGDLVGPAKQAGNDLEDQKVESVSAEAQAIGRVVEATTSMTKVKVRIFGRKALILS